MNAPRDNGATAELHVSRCRTLARGLIDFGRCNLVVLFQILAQLYFHDALHATYSVPDKGNDTASYPMSVRHGPGRTVPRSLIARVISSTTCTPAQSHSHRLVPHLEANIYKKYIFIYLFYSYRKGKTAVSRRSPTRAKKPSMFRICLSVIHTVVRYHTL